MNITGFNQILIKGKTHDLSKIRAQIIEQECDRVGDTSVDYGGIIFHANIRHALSTHLSQLRFEVVNDSTIKLGDAVIDLMGHEYKAYGKIFKGTTEEIKKQVTGYLETMNPVIRGCHIWLSNSCVAPNFGETFSEVKVRLIAKEMRKIENV